MKKLLYLLPVLFLLTSCGVFDTEETEAPIEYQLIVEFQSNEPISALVPRWVYTVNVIESNRLVPDTVLLDFTEFLNEGIGQLPIDLVDHSFNVTAERKRTGAEETYKVTNAFTSF